MLRFSRQIIKMSAKFLKVSDAIGSGEKSFNDVKVTLKITN